MTWELTDGLQDIGVVVTGAGGGIGREIALAFSTAGAHVCAIDVRQETVDAVIAEMNEPTQHLGVAGDLTVIEAHSQLLGQARETFGRLDVLVHCAAAIRRSTVDEVSEADWDFQHDINLKAAFFLNREAANIMRADGNGGRIVNFSSQVWWSGGYGGSVVYAASKGGIVSMSRGLARAYGRDGIRVNTVSPGFVDTSMLEGVEKEALQALIDQTPLGYIVDPKELTGVVLFLASAHATYITGATINVSGGFQMY